MKKQYFGVTADKVIYNIGRYSPEEISKLMQADLLGLLDMVKPQWDKYETIISIDGLDKLLVRS